MKRQIGFFCRRYRDGVIGLLRAGIAAADQPYEFLRMQLVPASAVGGLL